MLRRAVINRIRDQVPALGGRAFEAFLAPAGAGRPYATVKLPAAVGSPDISYAGSQPVEVRIYADPTSFNDISSVEAAVIQCLHGAEIQDAAEVPPGLYRLDWVPGGGEFADEERHVIGRLVMFETAALNERS
jgi:hypothetical protein